MRLDNLSVFVAVNDFGSFRRAADAHEAAVGEQAAVEPMLQRAAKD